MKNMYLKCAWVLMFILICSLGIASAGVSGQDSDKDTEDTPIEKLIKEYADVKGSRDFIASGSEMILARSLIRRTNLAPVASEVDVLEVLKMQNVAPDKLQEFEKDLKAALASYEYYGKADSKNGKVDVYLTRDKSGIVNELVIYNPQTQTLNSLKGSISPSTLESIKQ